jgi:thiamine biosynthesis lipoprotein
MPPETLAAVAPDGLRILSFPAMGTSVSVLTPEGDAEAARDTTRWLFAEWEATLSRFRSDSELSRLNASAGEWVVVSPLLYDVTAMALEAARATDGVFDPTLLRQLVSLGYDRTFAALPPIAPPLSETIAPGGGWRGIQLDHKERRIFLPAGVALDFGGIAKGMAADAAMDRLRETGVTRCCVNAGGDLATFGTPPDGDGWPIGVQGTRQMRMVTLKRGALATSGIANRQWRQGAFVRRHILDPRTGMPAETGLWSVTVAAERCAQAEAAAKAAFILGPREGARFLDERKLAGLFAHEDGSWQTAGDWPLTEHEGEYDKEGFLSATPERKRGACNYGGSPCRHQER